MRVVSASSHHATADRLHWLSFGVGTPPATTRPYRTRWGRPARLLHRRLLDHRRHSGSPDRLYSPTGLDDSVERRHRGTGECGPSVLAGREARAPRSSSISFALHGPILHTRTFLIGKRSFDSPSTTRFPCRNSASRNRSPRDATVCYHPTSPSDRSTRLPVVWSWDAEISFDQSSPSARPPFPIEKYLRPVGPPCRVATRTESAETDVWVRDNHLVPGDRFPTWIAFLNEKWRVRSLVYRLDGFTRYIRQRPCFAPKDALVHGLGFRRTENCGTDDAPSRELVTESIMGRTTKSTPFTPVHP